MSGSLPCRVRTNVSFFFFFCVVVNSLLLVAEDDSKEKSLDDGQVPIAIVHSRILRMNERIAVETNVKAGVEKMAKAMGNSAATGTDKFQPSQVVTDVFKTLATCTARLSLLNTAITK